jgi:Tol biopolymer transport system component
MKLRVAGLLVLAACSGGSGPIDAGGGGPARAELTPPAGLQFWNGRWSPDGKKIALHYSTKGASPADSIGVMDETGVNLTPVADAGTYLATAAWGPNGTTVFFTDSNGISKVPAAGGTATQLATPFAAFELDVSHDGTRLTYTTNGFNEVTLLELADGGKSSLHSGQAARFSPDGTLVAFVDGSSDKEHFWLYRFADKSVVDLGAANTYLASVGWFADNARLAVTSDKGIELLSLDGGRSVLYSDAFASTGIDVSSDSRKILYRVNGSTGLYVLTGF